MAQTILPHGTSKVCFRCLRNTNAENGDKIPKILADSFAKKPPIKQKTTTTTTTTKNRWDNNTLGYIYAEITYSIFSHNFYHRFRENLKSSVNFGNILGKYSWRVLANRAFHLNSEWNFAILFHKLIISSSNYRD